MMDQMCTFSVYSMWTIYVYKQEREKLEVKNYNGKEHEKEQIYMYNGVTLLYNNNEHNIVNQYTSIKNTHTQQKKKKTEKRLQKGDTFPNQ